MGGFGDWLRHAFAVEKDSQLTEYQRQLVTRLTQEVQRRELTVPAIAFLEMSRPLNNLTAQSLHFFHPMLSALFSPEDLQEWAHFLERSDAMDLLLAALERQEENPGAS